MASFAHTPRRKLTLDQFIEEYHLGREQKFELVDGEAWLMSGGTARHALTAGNILTALRARLRGTGCVPFGSDLLLAIDQANARLPDVAVYCDPRDLDDLDQVKFEYPKVLFEVLSTSTESIDRRAKVPEYQAIASVQVIVLVDARVRTFETFERVSADEWRNIKHHRGEPLILANPTITLTADEIFAI